MGAKTAAVIGLVAVAAAALAGCGGRDRPGRTGAGATDVAGGSGARGDAPGAGDPQGSPLTRVLPERAEPLTAGQAREAILGYLSGGDPDARRYRFIRESQAFVEGKEAGETPGGFHWGPWFVDRHTGRAVLDAVGEWGGYTLEAVVTTTAEGGRAELTDVRIIRVHGPVMTEPAEPGQP